MSYATLLTEIRTLRTRNRYCSQELMKLRQKFTGTTEEWNAAIRRDV